ncbi:hypothetical protein SAMN04488511_11622 [Pedobacter suwonensis]|uniref:Type IX secretion system protein PorV domain-containing protein n=1 Tax=Pedobacter suwonensis TaxID=332999 RepID=A0A1I0U045_9SPHI|nr:type IX secretion system outer membrane channel protein PorV [Pedobacter suwonensis]SFA56516.1 hypothetical protein SAMN04488511_11622 [Pedobacter suwonensis]
MYKPIFTLPNIFNSQLFGLAAFLIFGIYGGAAGAQSIENIRVDGSRSSNLLTSVPFLLITPQARAGAMGNAGVAIDADANSPSLNTAALANLKEVSSGFSFNYSPWLKNLTQGISLSFLSGYYRIDQRNTIAGSFRYFSIGDVNFFDDNQQELGIFNPNEFAVDVDYARSFGPEFSLGGGVRFIYSNLYSGRFTSGGQTGSGKAVAVDVSGLYRKEGYLFGGATVWSAGFSISNIGTKISYNIGDSPYFLPANLRIGGAATVVGQESKLILALDLNKLLVPTQPVYDANRNILNGVDPDRSVPSGIFGSFSDAPGGLNEEWQEVGISTGLEFSFKEKFAIRAGYNYQNPNKGDNSYLTLGAGFKYNVLTVDFSYLAGSVNSSPLANTLRFGLQFAFSKKRHVPN